jgi:hypothetical protein
VTTLAAASLPAMAMTPKKITVMFTRGGSFLTTGDHWYSEDGDYHLRDTTVGFHTYAISGQGISYEGSSEGIMWGNLHNVHSVGPNTVGDGGTITDSSIFFTDGNFEGIIQMKGTFVIYPETAPVFARGFTAVFNGEFRGVWHGTGIYAGQTLILEYEYVNGAVPSTLTGTLLIP